MTTLDLEPGRPALHQDVHLRQPGPAGGPWILESPVGRRYGVGDDFARIAATLDGGRTAAEVAAHAPEGRQWSEAHVDRVVAQLRSWGALAGPEDAPAGVAPGRWRHPSSLVWQVDLWRPSSVGPATAAVCRAVWSRAGVAVQALTGVLGCSVLLGPGREALRTLTQPATPAVLVGAVLIAWASLVLHELSHAGALIRAHGRPRRFGLMLFYLMPAAYCDVTDAWVLPRRHRALVILSGALAQFALAGGLFLAGALGAPAQLTTVAGVLMLLTCAVNLFPFVKLDGYLLVAALTHTPFLRDRSIDSFAQDCASLVGGVPASREVRWIRVFGVLAAASPVLLTAVVLERLVTTLSSWGMVGAVVITGLVGYAVGILLRYLWMVARRAARGPRATAGVAVAAVLCATAVVGASTLRVPTSVPVAYVAGSDGQVRLLYDEQDSCLVPDAGAPVQLRTNGIVRQQPLAVGRTDGPVTSVLGSPFAFVPLQLRTAPQTRMLAQDAVATVPAGEGVGEVRTEPRPLAAHLLTRVWRCGW